MNNRLLSGINFNNITEQVFPQNSLPAKESLNLGDIISKLLTYIFTLSGLVLFIFLIIGGFEMLTSAGNPESIKKAQEKITSALVGFVIIFLAYWLTQALEIIFGIQIF